MTPPAALKHPLTLSIYPTSHGLGWAALAGPLSPYDSGVYGPKGDKNIRCMAKVETLFDRLSPETLVLEAFERRNSGKSDRIARLCRSIAALANDRGVEFLIYSRLDVQHTFAPAGAHTRHEIAQSVARHLPALATTLPPKRKPWQSEDERMAIFNAAALVLTHYRHQALFFLDELKDAA